MNSRCGLVRFLSWYIHTWFDFPARRPYPLTNDTPTTEATR